MLNVTMTSITGLAYSLQVQPIEQKIKSNRGELLIAIKMSLTNLVIEQFYVADFMQKQDQASR